MSKQDLINQVQYIADTLSNGAQYCEECDTMHNYETEVCSCGNEDLRPLGAIEYMHDVLDIEYTVTQNKEFKSARLLVAFGGPNIWINTGNDTVEGYWGGDSYSCGFTDTLGLGEWAEEIFNC